MVIRFFKRWTKKLHHRLVLLEEYLDLGRRQNMPAHLVTKIMWNPAYAEDWVQMLRFVGPEEPVFLVDVGAHHGVFTAEFLRCWKGDARAVCVEPAAAAYGRLRTRFRNDPRIACLNLAVSDRDETRDMHICAESAMNTFHRYAPEYGAMWGGGVSSVRTERVSCRTLSAAVTLPPKRTVIVKIDAQGHEIPILEGSHQWFRGVDMVLCEVSFASVYADITPSFVQVASRLAQHDLWPIVFQTWSDAISSHAFERDVLFVRRSRLDRILRDTPSA